MATPEEWERYYWEVAAPMRNQLYFWNGLLAQWVGLNFTDCDDVEGVRNVELAIVNAQRNYTGREICYCVARTTEKSNG